jgi:hypothetical protein
MVVVGRTSSRAQRGGRGNREGGWRDEGRELPVLARLDTANPGSDRSAGEGPELVFTGCPGLTDQSLRTWSERLCNLGPLVDPMTNVGRATAIYEALVAVVSVRP